MQYPAHSLTVTSGNIALLSGSRLQRFTDTGNTVSRRVGNFCKTRWSNIRDNYRKSLRRIATKPLQDSNKIKKYKYAGALTFLDAYFQVREPISSIATEDNIEEEEEEESTTLQETGYSDIGTNNTVEVKNEVDEDCSECQETQKRSWPKKMAHTQERKCQQPQTSASIPMNHLMEEKNKTEPQVHSVDAFLAAIAQTLKTFTPYYLNLAKTKIFAIPTGIKPRPPRHRRTKLYALDVAACLRMIATMHKTASCFFRKQSPEVSSYSRARDYDRLVTHARDSSKR
uniref:MADF domain-containing protein n=1 Tax=Timema douglasi TaxID=61478 RepID=A0A7R8VS21_TIMDO|nr:unnamed protein product [Timema douglasi]